MNAGKAPVVLLLDTGNEWGGGTNSMIELLQRVDRAQLKFIACFYKDYPKGKGEKLSRVLGQIGVDMVVLPPVRQPWWAKALKETLRLAFFWNRQIRKRLVWQVDKLWRIDARKHQIAELARRTGAELIYTNNQPSSNLEGYLAGQLARLPVVQHCRIDVDLLPGEVAIVNETAAAVICVSRGVLESMAGQGIKRHLLSYVYDGFDIPVSASPQGSDRFTFGTVCNLMPRKSVDHLLKAAARMKEQGESHFRVLIAGDGAERQSLETLAKSLSLENEVEFLGFVQEPLPIIAAMDVFAFCSAKEGLARVLIEAMSLEKPVISSNVIGPQEVVDDGKTGFLYEYGDVEKLASLLMALRRNPPLRQQLGAAGRKRAQQVFTVESYVGHVSRVLSKAALK
jgi:glycosyltransferase involved in cell wall biosynthesis